MNIFWHELRENRISTITWMLALSLMTIFFLSLYPLFSRDVTTSMKILENLPEQLRLTLGISLQDFFTIAGFYAYVFTFVLLAGGIQAMNLGVGLVAREQRQNTLDFLLTKPVGRTQILWQKIAAALVILVVTVMVFGGVSLVAAMVIAPNNGAQTILLLLVGILFLVQLLFFVIGLLLSVCLSRVRSIIGVSLPTVFGLFIVGSLGAIIQSDMMRYLTPFKLYDLQYVIQHHAYESWSLIFEIVVVLVCLVASFVIFSKKDVAA